LNGKPHGFPDPAHAEILPHKDFAAAPFGSKDAPVSRILSNRYFGIGQYVRLIDSPFLIWPNFTNLERNAHRNWVFDLKLRNRR
jgi:hypothetical protein